MSGVCVRELTASGTGGISLLEVRGPGARQRLVSRWPEIGKLAGGGLGLCTLTDDDETALDVALVRVVDDDCVELSLHGAPVVVACVRAALARLVGGVPEEDSEGPPEGCPEGCIEARAADRLGRARTEAEARTLLDQAEGALRRALERLAQAPDSEFEGLRAQLERRAELFARLARPSTVVLAGAVNAGKSTLFNVLCGSERVVVSDQPGTTRDLVSECVHFGAWPVELVDTAGEREAPGGGQAEIERAGQRLSRELRARADLVLWLVPQGTPEDSEPAIQDGQDRQDGQQDGRRELVVVSRADRLEPGPRPSLSALERPRAAAALVHELFRQAFDLPREPWEPSAGVPFEAAQRAWLAELAALPAERRPARLAELLEPEARSNDFPH